MRAGTEAEAGEKGPEEEIPTREPRGLNSKEMPDPRRFRDINVLFAEGQSLQIPSLNLDFVLNATGITNTAAIIYLHIHM